MDSILDGNINEIIKIQSKKAAAHVKQPAYKYEIKLIFDY